MKIRTIKYYFEEAVKSIFRNSIMSVTSILTVSSCILILIFSYCVATNIDFILQKIENTVGVTVFIDDKLTTQEVEALDIKIKALANVKDTKFISSEDALNSMAKGYGENADIILGLKDKKPIKRSFSIALKSAQVQGDTIKELEAMQEDKSGIVKVVHAKKTIDALITINNIVRAISVLNVLILGFLSVVIIMNTIKLTVNNRRHDINIMKYVGATDWFIRIPFIIEGILIGLAGAVVPIIISNILYIQGVDFLSKETVSVSNLISFKTSVEIFSFLTPVMLILGISIGAFASVVSIRKHLNV